jgi:5-methylcytosine-specific restriction endonuclease McrA
MGKPMNIFLILGIVYIVFIFVYIILAIIYTVLSIDYINMRKKICSYPGCNTLIEPTERYCAKHIIEHKPFENAIRYNEALYNTSQWRSLRKEKIKECPYCELCGAESNLEVHHKVPPEGNEELFFNRDNLQVVCSACHRIITAREIWKK